MWQPQALGAFYVDVLQDRLGITAQLDEEGDVVFEVEGARMFVQNPGPRDPAYLRVVLGSRFGDVTPEQLAAAACEANSRWKTVKATSWDDVLELSCESFVAPERCRPDADHVAVILPRSIAVLLGAMHHAADGLASDAEQVGEG
jgi:hypothetical protein